MDSDFNNKLGDFGEKKFLQTFLGARLERSWLASLPVWIIQSAGFVRGNIAGRVCSMATALVEPPSHGCYFSAVHITRYTHYTLLLIVKGQPCTVANVQAPAPA